MSYRSFRRVLGETSLERKCRILFGICLLLLIFGAFWWVDRVAENLIRDSNRRQASRLIAMQLQRLHFENNQIFKINDDQNAEIAKNLQTPNVPYEILVLDKDRIEKDGMTYHMIKPHLPVSGKERKLVQELKSDTMHWIQKLDQRFSDAETDEIKATLREKRTLLENSALVASNRGKPSLYRERFVDGEYLYYEPLHFTTSCQQCHHNAKPNVLTDGLAAAAKLNDRSKNEAGETVTVDHIMKISLPSNVMQTAINRVRAILISVAILTIFFAVFALYLIIRYVIVKPLQHLQDVSDSISQGDQTKRAELTTGDEFEELAVSFNRMLRHMTDTQNKLQRVNDDLDHKVDELARANLQLYETNQLKSDFLANMSHELRTPLNSIIGFSEVLQDIDSLNDKQKRFATNISSSGHLLLQMINEILDLAKIEAGKMEVKPIEFSIESVVNAHCEMVRPLTEQKNIDLRIDCSDDLPLAYQDQVKIQQILNNLLSNAIKFTPEGGRITVTVRKTEKGNMQLVVEDTGVGIADEDRDVVFEKFRQGSTPKVDGNLTREFSGTGLGLSIIKELCLLLDGQINLTSAIGKGSKFVVTLPWERTTETLSVAAFNKHFSDLTKTRLADLYDSE